jgi:chromosome segregation ATPase
MQPKSLEDRVTLLEKNLQGLPERVGALETGVTELTGEFVQFRGEVRAEFSATRDGLRKEIRDGDEETRRLMRVLHEDLVARIALLDRG